MNQAIDMTINYLPAPTWNWLKTNEISVGSVAVERRGEYKAEIPEGISEEITDYVPAEVRSGAGPDMDRLIAASGICSVRLSTDADIEAPVRLDFSYEKKPSGINALELAVGKNARMTVIMNFASDDDAAGTAAVQTRYHVAPGALLRLVQVQKLGKDVTFFNDIGGVCEDGGRFELIQLVLSGRQTYLGCRTELSGTSSAFTADIGYRAAAGERIDMNYVANHTGRKGDSRINASGVLSGDAFKLFRGTIDLHRGCGGSVGNEKEDVLLLSEDAVNQTIPLILCDEEDVEGNHGASIGRPDADQLFYLASRGIPEEEACRMMAAARIDAVSSLIPDEKTRKEVRAVLHPGEEN